MFWECDTHVLSRVNVASSMHAGKWGVFRKDGTMVGGWCDSVDEAKEIAESPRQPGSVTGSGARRVTAPAAAMKVLVRG